MVLGRNSRAFCRNPAGRASRKIRVYYYRRATCLAQGHNRFALPGCLRYPESGSLKGIRHFGSGFVIITQNKNIRAILSHYCGYSLDVTDR